LHYKILSAIGSGGMGEVYLAKDSNLERKVAIKVLRKKFGKNEEGLVRFVREARSASALNHPNIITIYEIGESNGSNYIASEYIDGKTLHSRLKGEHLSVSEVLDISIQVAEAVSAAHAAGIIHRDIKPENVMIRNDGYVKVLDFGLAKLSEREFFSADHDAVTHKLMRTNPGVVMGTVSYMSPEQTRGSDVDPRSDIWSLGVLIYEMASGSLPFAGETTSDVIAAILTSSPRELSQQSPDVPKELDHIVRKALRKSREERYQDIRDMVLDLKLLRGDLVVDSRDRVFTKPVETARFAVTTQDDGRHKTMDFVRGLPLKWYLIPTLIIVGLVAAWFAWRSGSSTATAGSQQLTSTQIASWKSYLSESDSERPRLSPDGKLLAYVAAKDGKLAIWLKQLDGGEPFTQKQGDSTDSSPLWSPDGGRIAFLSEREGQRGIWAMPAFGGLPVLLTPLEARSPALVHWSRDGTTIYFVMNQNLFSLDTATKSKTQITNFDVPIGYGFGFSPDEKRIVYVDQHDGKGNLVVSDLNGGNSTQIANDAVEYGQVLWLSDGQRILYNSYRKSVKQICLAFLDGRPPIQLTFGDSDANLSDISADGSKILYTSTRDEADLWGMLLNDGKEFQLTSDIGLELWQDVSPGGESIAYQAARQTTGGYDLFNCLLISQKIGGDAKQIQLAENGFGLRWSPDGSQLAFLRSEADNNSLWVVSAGGGDSRAIVKDGVVFGGQSLLPNNRLQTQDYQWLPDSRSLIYSANRNGLSNIWQTNANGGGEKNLTNSEDQNLFFFNPSISPDGKQIAVLSLSTADESRFTWGVWILSEDRREQIYRSDSVTSLLGWSPSGGEVIIKSLKGPKQQSLPVEVSISQISAAGKAQRLISTLEMAYFYNVQLSPDRSTLALVTRSSGSDEIRVLAMAGGAAKSLINSSDTRVYFSNLSFAPDSKAIYYGKQANWQIISTIDNFR